SDRISPQQAAARARQAGVKVYTVGIGQRGRTARLDDGNRVGLDEATLQRIAATTGGEYSYAAEAAQLEQIYKNLGSQVTWVRERTEVTPVVTALGTALMLASGLFGLRWFQQLP